MQKCFHSSQRAAVAALTALLLAFSGCSGAAASYSSSGVSLEGGSGILDDGSGISGSSDTVQNGDASSQDDGASTGEPSSVTQATMAEAYVFSGTASGMMLSICSGGDIDPAGLDNGALQDKLDAAVDFAAGSGLSTIYVEVKQGGATLYSSKIFDPLVSGFSFDILEYICVSAAARGIQIYAVADLLSASGSGLSSGNPAVLYSSSLLSGDSVYFDPSNSDTNKFLIDSCTELATYPVAGIVLDGLDLYGVSSPSSYSSALSGLIRSVSGAIGSRKLGIMYDGVDIRTVTADMTLALTTDGTVNNLYPRVYSAIDYYYISSLAAWISGSSASSGLYSVNAAYKVTDGRFGKNELYYQLFHNSTRTAVNGAVLESYSDLLAGALDMETASGMLSDNSGHSYISVDTSIQQSLEICYPSGNITTSDSAIYLMGTSDPSQTLSINGSDVTRYGTRGCFGVKVSLALGANVFTVRQGGGASDSVTITRVSESSGVSTISIITTASRFPSADIGVESGSTLKISCIGPSGGTITASVGGQTVTLKQAAATAVPGVAATFTGTVVLTSSGSGLTNAGNVKYTLQYNGVSSSCASEGRVYVASAGTRLAVRVTDYYGSVLSDKNDTAAILGAFKKDAIVNITGCESISGGAAFVLEDGSYITTAYASLYTGSSEPDYTVSGLSVSYGDGDELLTFRTGGIDFTAPVYGSLSGGVLTLKFFGADFSSLPSASSSFISGVTCSSFTGGTSVRLTVKSGAELWGYNIEYDGSGNIVLRLRSAPSLSDKYGKPLSGITIVIDPGHSGNDPGALGVAYNEGPSEKEMNLAAAAAVKYRLEQLGATVVLTHDGSEGRVYMDARCQTAEDVMADLFISLHHNSSSAVKDHSESNWMECYYFHAGSKALASELLTTLNSELGRVYKGPYNSNYYVTRLTFAPAVLLELGFVINPQQYEECCSVSGRYKTACAIADAIVSYLGG